MIKFFILIVCFYNCAFLFGQEVFGDISIQIKDSLTKQSYIYKVFRMEEESYCDFYLGLDEKVEFQQFLDSHYNNFTLVKSKEDSVLIFDGKRCPGFTSGEVIVYKTEGNNFVRHFSKPGKIAFLENKNITIHSYPCCAMITNILSTYDLQKAHLVDSNHVFFSSYKHTDYIDVECFRRSEKSKERVELNKEVNLRFIDDTEKPDFPINACQNDDTNIIGVFPKASKGYFVKYNKDKTWALIQLKSTNAKELFCPLNYEKSLLESNDFYVYGWIRLDDFVRK